MVSCQGTLYAGSSKQGKARRASVASKKVNSVPVVPLVLAVDAAAADLVDLTPVAEDQLRVLARRQRRLGGDPDDLRPAGNDARGDVAPIGGELDAVDLEVDGVQPDDGGGALHRELDGDLPPKPVGGRVEREVERVARGRHVAGEPECRRLRRGRHVRRRALPSAGQGERDGDDEQSANHRRRIADQMVSAQ